MTRRSFLGLVAAGSAALVAPGLALAATAPAAPSRARAAAGKPRPATGTRAPDIEKGIREQKESLEKQLQVIRGYVLPPGSDMAFVFRPMRARKR